MCRDYWNLTSVQLALHCLVLFLPYYHMCRYCPAGLDLYCLFLFQPYFHMCSDNWNVTSVKLALTFTVSFYFNHIITCARTTGT